MIGPGKGSRTLRSHIMSYLLKEDHPLTRWDYIVMIGVGAFGVTVLTLLAIFL